MKAPIRSSFYWRLSFFIIFIFALLYFQFGLLQDGHDIIYNNLNSVTDYSASPPPFKDIENKADTLEEDTSDSNIYEGNEISPEEKEEYYAGKQPEPDDSEKPENQAKEPVQDVSSDERSKEYYPENNEENSDNEEQIIPIQEAEVNAQSETDENSNENDKPAWLSRFIKNQEDIMSGKTPYKIVYATMHSTAGNCNRLMNLLSAFLLAILTDRALVFESGHIDVTQLGKEAIAQAAFFDLFKEVFRANYSVELENSYTITYPLSLNNCENYTEKFDGVKVVNAFRFDYWGYVLTRNELYLNILDEIGYPVFQKLSDVLFQPSDKVLQYVRQDQCDIGIQIRRNWDRKTAEDEQFNKYANIIDQNVFNGSSGTWLISTDDKFNDEDFSKPVALLGDVCRNTNECNIKSIADMVSLSKCKQFITTYSSTYARCSAGMAGVIPYVMGDNGAAFKQVTSEPVDAGAIMPFLEIVPFIEKCKPRTGFYGLKATTVFQRSVTLQWSSPSPETSEFLIQVCNGKGESIKAVTVNSNDETISTEIDGLEPGTEYTFQVSSPNLSHLSFKVSVSTEEDFKGLDKHSYDNGELIHVRIPVYQSTKSCFVYILLSIDHDRIGRVKASLKRLDRYFNVKYGYDVVVLHGDSLTADVKKDLHSYTLSNLIFFDVSEEVKIPDDILNDPEVPKIWKFSEDADGGFSLNYRNMGRFAAGPIFMLKIFDNYEWFWKIDDDSFLLRDVEKDPFVHMAVNDKTLGFVHEYSDLEAVTVNLGDTFKLYLKQNNLTMKDPEKIFPGGQYSRWNYYGCSLIGNFSFFKSKEYQDIFHFLDTFKGWYKYRWDEQKVYAFALALYKENSGSISLSDIIHLRHQELLT